MSRVWDWLRMTRASPGGVVAADPERAGVYRAALQQFEELMRAAQSSGPASRPLPLFYALAQAGRAIVAVKGGPDHKGHGLGLGALEPQALDTTVGPVSLGRMPGHFQAIAQAMQSRLLAGPAPLGALMASLPEMADTLLMHDDWPPALAVFERAPYRVQTPGWIHVTIVVDDPAIDFDRLVTILDPYPSTKGRIGVPEVVKSFGNLPTHFTPDGVGVGVMFKGDASDLDTAAPQYRITGWRWIRPTLGGAEAPDPLVTWW